jgi:hypothetical protein
MIDLRKVLDVLDVDPLGKHHIYCFKVVLNKKSLILCADTEEDRTRWVSEMLGIKRILSSD